ncbi:MAG: hypothetical protein ITD39_08345 [Nitrospira sp.]|nr:hypothetical protein [Nitrospira sp.]
MTPRSEINNRPINQAAAYWMRQVGEEPGWDQPIDQRLFWGTENGLMRGGRTPGGRPVPRADDTDGGNGGRGMVDRHTSRRTTAHDMSQDQEKYSHNPLPSFGG